MDYKAQKDRVLDFKEFTVIDIHMRKTISKMVLYQKIMDEIKDAGWVRFKPVEGQPINDKDIKKVFKMVDMDKSGAISQLVNI